MLASILKASEGWAADSEQRQNFVGADSGAGFEWHVPGVGGL